jgi:GNAT superfamily N-acetyltransferase
MAPSRNTYKRGMKIVRLRPNDAQAVKAAATLLDKELGEGMYPSNRLERDAADPTAVVWLAVERMGALVGAAVARLLIGEDVDYYLRFGRQVVDLFRGSVGSFEAVAVDPSHRRAGIGRRLTEASLDWMADKGCTAAITIAWESGRPDASGPMFRRMGFLQGPTVSRFYTEESIRDGWICPVCGGPCVCAATLFTLELGARTGGP